MTGNPFRGGAQVDSYAYPAGSNRLASVALAAGGTRNLGYDAAGNVISDSRAGGPYGYSYDAAGRLASVTVGGVVQAEYKYNALGQQAVRTFPGSGQSIHSVYGPDGNRIAEYDGGSGALIREYVWFEGAPIAVIEGGVVYFLRSDHIGRPTFATTSAGTVVWTASWLPFGGVHVTSGAPIEARFPGQWFQMESGLAPELDARLRSDHGAVYRARPAGAGRWSEHLRVCKAIAAKVDGPERGRSLCGLPPACRNCGSFGSKALCGLRSSV